MPWIIGSCGGSTGCQERHINELDAKVKEEDVLIRGDSKSIGYRALLNRNQALWRPSGEMHLNDIDNKYYLV
ncbi:hypothetical protein GQ457_18G011090 [Hibiscus cannabinus]